MLFRCLSPLLVVICLDAQTTPAAPQTAETSSAVIATVNGRKITKADFDRMLAAMPDSVRRSAETQPREVLEQLATFDVLREDAEKAKLHEQSPYKERLAEARRQILIEAQLDQAAKTATISPEDVKRQYEENKSRYSEARAKVIFISAVSSDQPLDKSKPATQRDPEASKKLAHEIIGKLKLGADFVALAKEHSDDGSTADTGADYPDAIRGSSAGIPQEMRDAILAANERDILGPFEHQSGWYIFRVESVKRKSLPEASKEILEQQREARIQQALAEARTRAVVTMEPVKIDIMSAPKTATPQ